MAKEVKKTAIAKPQEKTAVSKAAAIRGELQDVSSWALVSSPEALEATTYNLQGETLSEFDLDRIRVPAGGGTFFEVPVLGESDPQPASTIRGILLSVSPRRAYWEDANPSGNPPDCSSDDGIRGIGTPGGDCAGCPFAEFGSAIKQDGSAGRGKRCRESRVLLMLREDDRLPVAIVAPAASIKNVRKYLASLPVFMFAAITELSLEKDKNPDGTVYSKINLRYAGHIDAETAKLVKGYAAAIKESVKAKRPMGADSSVYGGAAAAAADPIANDGSSFSDFVPDDTEEDSPGDE